MCVGSTKEGRPGFRELVWSLILGGWRVVWEQSTYHRWGPALVPSTISTGTQKGHKEKKHLMTINPMTEGFLCSETTKGTPQPSYVRRSYLALDSLKNASVYLCSKRRFAVLLCSHHLPLIFKFRDVSRYRKVWKTEDFYESVIR